MKSYLMNFTMAGLLGSGDDAAKVIQEPVDRINATLETLRNSFEHIDTPILIVCLRTYLQALEATEHESCIRCADNLQKVIGAMAIRTRKEVDRNER